MSDTKKTKKGSKKSWQSQVQQGFKSAFETADEIKIPGTNKKLGDFVDRTSR